MSHFIPLKFTFKECWTHYSPVVTHIKPDTLSVVFSHIQTLTHAFRPVSCKLQHGDNEDYRTVLKLFSWHDNKQLCEVEFLLSGVCFSDSCCHFVVEMIHLKSSHSAVSVLTLPGRGAGLLMQDSLHTLYEWWYVFNTCVRLCVSANMHECMLASCYMWVGIWTCEKEPDCIYLNSCWISYLVNTLQQQVVF